MTAIAIVNLILGILAVGAVATVCTKGHLLARSVESAPVETSEWDEFEERRAA